MATLEKLHQLVEVKEGVDDVIVSCNSAEESNKRILDLLITAINDENLMFVCDVMEEIVDPEMNVVVHALRNGMNSVYACISIVMFLLCSIASTNYQDTL